MAVELITKEDLTRFKHELFSELQNLLTTMKPQQKRWLKSREVITMLKISPGTLQNYRISGKIPFRKIGNTIYYSADEIDKLFDSGMNN